MLITSTKNPSISSMLANQWRSTGSHPVAKATTAIADHPLLFATDAVDLGAGITTALGGLEGKGGDVLHGTTFLMGATHAVKGFYHLIHGLNDWDSYNEQEGKHHFTMAAGEGLTAAGQFCSAAGVGPVSLGFLGLGMLITNASTLSN